MNFWHLHDTTAGFPKEHVGSTIDSYRFFRVPESTALVDHAFPKFCLRLFVGVHGTTPRCEEALRFDGFSKQPSEVRSVEMSAFDDDLWEVRSRRGKRFDF